MKRSYNGVTTWRDLMMVLQHEEILWWCYNMKRSYDGVTTWRDLIMVLQHEEIL